MSNTPYASAAGVARQRLAGVLGTLQQDPNIPPQVLEIVSGLARAVGPLFQLERGSTDTSQFVTARGVLQETLEKMQGVDQNYPGIAEATGAIAETLKTIFTAMRDNGLVPGAPAKGAVQPPAQPPVAQAQAPQAQSAGRAPSAPQRPPSQPQQRAAAPNAPAPEAARTGSHGKHDASRPQATAPLGPNGLPRLEAELGVHSESNFYTDFVGDLRKEGGVFVATYHVLPIGSECEVAILFPGNLTADVRGIVKWRREIANLTVSATSSPGLGVHITQASAEAWSLVDRYVRRREPIVHEG